MFHMQWFVMVLLYHGAFMSSLLKQRTCHLMLFHCQTDLRSYASLCGTGSLVNGTWVATTRLERIHCQEDLCIGIACKKDSLLVASETEN